MPQQQGLSQASFAPQGPGVQGPSAAIRALQEMASLDSQRSQKATQRIMQMQQQADQQAQAQAQQIQGGVTDLANQVAGGLQRMQDQKHERELRVEQTKTSEDMMLFQQKLATESQKEGERIGLAMKQANQATMNAIQTWNAKGEQMRANHNGVGAAFDIMVNEGTFGNIPGGYQKMADIQKALRMSEAYVEDHTDPSYLSHATNLMQQAERDIAEGRDPVDLAAMYDRPTSSSYAGIDKPMKRVDSVAGEQRFAMMLRKGYPEEGIFAMAQDDPRREHVDIVTPDVLARVLIDNSTMSALITNESRKKFMDYQMRSLVEADGKYQQYSSQYKKINEMTNARAPEAVRMAIESFNYNPDPGKFSEPGKALFDEALMAMFPEVGNKLAKMADGIRNRSTAMDTAVEFSSAATLESAAMAIENRAIFGLVTSQNASGSGLAEAALDYLQAVGPEAAAQKFGPDSIDKNGEYTGVGMVKAQREVQKSLEGLKVFAGEVRQAANEVGALEGFRKEFGTNSRLTDLYLYNYFTAQGEAKTKAQEMLYGQIQQNVDELALEDLDRLSVAPTEQTTQYRNILDSTLEMVQTIGPYQLPKIATLLSGGQVDLTDGSIQKFNAGTASTAERSAYLQLTLDAMRDKKEIAKSVAKMKAQGRPVTPEQVLQMRKAKQDERAQKAETLRTTFKRGGVLGVIGRGVTGGYAGPRPPMKPGSDTLARLTGIEAGAAVGRFAGEVVGGQNYTDLINSLAESIAGTSATPEQ